VQRWHLAVGCVKRGKPCGSMMSDAVLNGIEGGGMSVQVMLLAGNVYTHSATQAVSTTHVQMFAGDFLRSYRMLAALHCRRATCCKDYASSTMEKKRKEKEKRKRKERKRTERNRTEQNGTEQNRTERNRTEQNRTEQNRKQNKRPMPFGVN